MDNGQIIEQGSHAGCSLNRAGTSSLNSVCRLFYYLILLMRIEVKMRLVQLSRHSIAFLSEGALREPNGLLALGGDLSPRGC